MAERLKMLPIGRYKGVNYDDPIRFYNFPVIGKIYRRRVELCLSELRGGGRILEVGFGAGVTFLNLHQKYQNIYGLDLTANIDDITALFKELNIAVHLKNGNILNMPFPDNYFEAVLLISILEHLRPDEQDRAFCEISRVLSHGGQIVYGVPVQRPLMDFLFKALGYDIKGHHLSSEKEIAESAGKILKKNRIIKMGAGPFGSIYEVGHFIKI